MQSFDTGTDRFRPLNERGIKFKVAHHIFERRYFSHSIQEIYGDHRELQTRMEVLRRKARRPRSFPGIRTLPLECDPGFGRLCKTTPCKPSAYESGTANISSAKLKGFKSGTHLPVSAQ